ncbi:TonB-dependent receptor [Rhizorhabdus phycosphaerae]|uniref:TonB-dependent receptor n=1 Tax=Rhizorhabdus phycosphaerae TaxID=2711156 RepID=UPI001D032831|nr:TonB-dependent receptor [Rhizorhabdus phycosphaerae]
MMTISARVHRTSRIAAMLLTGLSSQALMAQAATDDAVDESMEIVVTAQKRSERLQDVPISVSAIGGDAVRKQRLTSADDLVSKVANLQLTSTVGDGTPIFALRGVSMSDYSLNQSGPVATYYDEVYKGNFAFLGVALYDLERVEVLRGPQGTLYGKNTTGGAVNLISHKPDLGKVEGYLNLGYGNYNRHEANGAINLPLGETVAARVAFTAARAEGWFRNQLPGQPDLNGTREYAVRGSMLWEPKDGTSFLLRASTSYQNPRNYGIFAAPGPDGVGVGLYESLGQGSSYFRTGIGRRQIESNYTPRRRARTYALALTSTFDIGNDLSIVSVSSWDKGRLNFGEDTDGAPNKTLEIFYGDRASQLSQDLRLASSWGGPFEFILGAYYNREKVFNTTDFGIFKDADIDGSGTIDAADCAAGLPAACSVVNSFDQLKHSYALYTDMHYDFGGGFTLRGGLRYTRDDGKQKGLRSDALGVDGSLVATLIPPTTLSFKNDNISGKIGIDYKIDRDRMIYASYSRGYRAPSFNAQAFFDPSEASVAKPETIDAFEGGAKLQLADRRITLNLAGFYYLYKNQQFINVSPQTAAQTLVNVDKSRIFGGEVEFNARASEFLSVRASLGLLNAKIKKGILSGVDVKGNRLSNAPSVSANAGLDITLMDDDAGKLSLHPDISYVSSQYFEVFNVPRLRQSAYALFGGHIDFERGPVSVSIWGKNLTNKFYVTSRVDLTGGFGFDYNHVGAPRTYGATIGYKF